MEKIKSAVIGCGRMGAFTSESVKKYSPKCWFPLSHVEALDLLKDTDLIAICDTNKSLLDKAKSLYQVKKTYRNYKELLDANEIELLCVATRTPERANIIKYAVNAGVRAFHLEKPLCNSMEQLNSLELIIQEKKIFLSYGALRPYINIYKKAKDLVDSGSYGKLMQIQVNFGKAPLYWTHPHSVDIILFFAGFNKLNEVQASLSNIHINKEKEVESDPIIEQAAMYFDNGLVGTISKIGGMDVVLGCETATVTVKSDGECIVVSKPTGLNPYHVYPGVVTRDNTKTPQGTYAAIDSLLISLKSGSKQNEAIQNRERIFIGQRTLFGFVDSALKNSCIVPISKIDPNIVIKGKTGDLFA
jgi:scyllo-inositol 2-dehydrogenase (NAD+)